MHPFAALWLLLICVDLGLYYYSSCCTICRRIYVKFPLFWNLSLRTSTFSQIAKYFDTGSRPEPVIEVGARSEHCSSRGVPSKYFFRRKRIRRFPGFLCMRPILYVRTGNDLSVCPLSRAHSPGHTTQADNRTCREYDVTTLPPISISRQHRACVTCPSALYCCGYSSCVHRSLRPVIHHLYLCLLLLCVTDPCSLWTEM